MTAVLPIIIRWQMAEAAVVQILLCVIATERMKIREQRGRYRNSWN
jgi:hypothetical protein